MDYKQKYERALEYMRTVYPTLNGVDKEDVEHYFSELKESEDEENIMEAIIALIEFGLEDKSAIAPGYNVTKEQSIAWLKNKCKQKSELKESEDEKVRKHLLKHFRNKTKNEWNGIPVKNILSWLEKQGEQKSVGIPMTLDEAIAHCKEKSSGDSACASQHRQLAQWLTELKEYKEKKSAKLDEDEKMIKTVITIFDRHISYIEDDSEAAPDVKDFLIKETEKCIVWFKSIISIFQNRYLQLGFKWHSMIEKPEYPCDIIYVADNGNMFIYRYLENGKPNDITTPTFSNLIGGKWCYCKDIISKKTQANTECIQWTGKNLKEVTAFTGKSAKFDEWFKSWDEYEAYVHSHGDIFKLFCEDGSHYEVPLGAWIVKTPDGYNVASRATYIEKPCKKQGCFIVDKKTIDEVIERLKYLNYWVCGGNDEIISKLKHLKPQPIDKVEPKFKVGDTIRPKGSLTEYIIESISEECYHGKGWGLSIGCEEDYELVKQNLTWDEKDERIKDNCIKYIKASCLDHKEFIECIDWLESLKERYGWKPTDEQMKQLGWVAVQNKDNMIGKELMPLYQDLKKLKGE